LVVLAVLAGQPRRARVLMRPGEAALDGDGGVAVPFDQAPVQAITRSMAASRETYFEMYFL